jgi:hypothetical protein
LLKIFKEFKSRFKIIGNCIKRNITPEIIIKLRNEGNLRKNVIDMPDGDEIDDIEEASVDDDPPPPRNRHKLSCQRGVSRRTRCNFYAIF